MGRWENVSGPRHNFHGMSFGVSVSVTGLDFFFVSLQGEKKEEGRRKRDEESVKKWEHEKVGKDRPFGLRQLLQRST